LTAGRLCAGCTFALLLSSQAENIDRKDFTVEERVAIGEAIEKLIGERRGKPFEKVENFPQYKGKKHVISQRKKLGSRTQKPTNRSKL
jgi:hypothetical protein